MREAQRRSRDSKAHEVVRRRAYRMGARADAAAATGERIIHAAIQQFSERLYDEVSLADVAAAARVTIKTVLRRYTSKEDLVAAAAVVGLERVRSERADVQVGDLLGAIRNLGQHYELWGDRVLGILAQERRVPALQRVTDEGRKLHYAWVDHVFGPWLTAVATDARAPLRAQLIAVTDVYVWKVLRRDLGLSAEATEASIRRLVEAALA